VGHTFLCGLTRVAAPSCGVGHTFLCGARRLKPAYPPFENGGLRFAGYHRPLKRPVSAYRAGPTLRSAPTKYSGRVVRRQDYLIRRLKPAVYVIPAA